MSTQSIIGMAVVYTLIVAIAVSFTDVSGAVVIAVAWAWFNVGRMVGRGVPKTAPKWGRQ